MKKLLLVFAHPDDETFAIGGTVAKYVKTGWQVDLVCATKGEAGSSGSYNVSSAALGVLREKELQKATDILGINRTTFLGYRDGKLSLLTPGTLEDPIYRVMEAELPDVVITFDVTGVSNHPDHVKISYATTYAFQKYAAWLEGLQRKFRVRSAFDETWFRRLETIVTKKLAPKLYYTCIPASIASYIIKEGLMPPESFGRPLSGIPDDQITTIIDIKKYSDRKLQALKAHESQMADVDRFLQVEGNPMFDQEYLILRMEGTGEHFMGKNDRIGDRL